MTLGKALVHNPPCKTHPKQSGLIAQFWSSINFKLIFLTHFHAFLIALRTKLIVTFKKLQSCAADDDAESPLVENH